MTTQYRGCAKGNEPSAATEAMNDKQWTGRPDPRCGKHLLTARALLVPTTFEFRHGKRPPNEASCLRCSQLLVEEESSLPDYLRDRPDASLLLCPYSS